MMTTPTTGTVATVGGTSGMAPFPVHWYADIEVGGSTWATGSGEWPEGRWELQVIDNGTGEVYSPSLSRNAMTVTCPTNGHTASAFDRIGAVGYAGAVIWDAGSYKCRLRYQNRDGDWSAWADSSTITVSADTRTTYYVDGTSGSDANDGTSWAQAKVTLNGGLGLVSSNNCKVVFKDDTSIAWTAAVDVSAYSGVVLTRSWDGASAPQVAVTTTNGVTAGEDFVVDGVDLTSYASATTNSVYALNADNVALCGFSFGKLYLLANFSGSRGLLVFGCTQSEQIDATIVFGVADATGCCNILGCNFSYGSAQESVVRIGADTGETNTRLSVDFSTIIDSGDALKHTLRAYVSRFCGVYRSKFGGGQVWFGYNHIDSQIDYYDYRVDCSVHVVDGSEASLANNGEWSIGAGMHNFYCAAFHYWAEPSGQPNIIKLNYEGAAAAADHDNVYFRNVSFYAGGTATATQSLLYLENPDVLRWGLSGCVIASKEAIYTASWRRIVSCSAPTGDTPSAQQNVWFDHSVYDIALINDGSAYADAAALNAQAWAEENIDGNLTIARDTGAVSGGTAHQGIVTDITGVFESLTAGTGYTTEIDRTLSAWDAGAVQRDAMLVREATTTGTTFTDPNPGLGVQEYRVLAIVGYDEGDWSDVVSVTFAAAGTGGRKPLGLRPGRLL